MYTPYMTLYLVISLPESPHIHRTYVVLANLYIHRCQFKSPYTVHIWFWPILYIHAVSSNHRTLYIYGFGQSYIYTAVSSNHRTLYIYGFGQSIYTPLSVQITATAKYRTQHINKPSLSNKTIRNSQLSASELLFTRFVAANDGCDAVHRRIPGGLLPKILCMHHI